MFIGTAFWQTPEVTVTGATQTRLWGMIRNGSTSSLYSTSPTASTWTVTNIGASSAWYQMAYSDTTKLFVAVAETAASTIRRSSDMITFTSSYTLPANHGLRTIRWFDGLGCYIAGGTTNFTTGAGLLIYTSTDGINFTTQSTPAVTGFIEDVCYSSDQSLAVAVSGPNQIRVITSPDGVTWTSRTAPTGQWHGCAYGNGIYVIGGINGYLGTSSNGIDCGVTASAGSWRRFAYSPTLNLFVGTRYNGTIAYSSNGISWTASNSGSSTWWDVIWSPEEARFAVTRLSQTQPVYTSTDGINWTIQSTSLTSGSYTGIAYRKQIL